MAVRGECKTAGGKLVAVRLDVSGDNDTADNDTADNDTADNDTADNDTADVTASVDGDFFLEGENFAVAAFTADLDRTLTELATPYVAGVTADNPVPIGDAFGEMTERIAQTIRRHGNITLIGTSAQAIATALLRALRHLDHSASPASPGTSPAVAPAHQASAFAIPVFPGEWLGRWKRLAPTIVMDVPRGPSEQMDVDERWASEVASGRRGPTMRFWQWAAPAVVVGRFQSIPDEVHEDVAAREGFTVVRRCTGGGAMFIEPGNTITYSLYAPHGFLAGLTVTQSYRLSDMWLIAALRRIGIEAGFSGVNDIASPSGKIGGAAQRRFPPHDGGPGAVLHHVTLAYDIDAAAMARVLDTSAEKMSDKAVRSAVKRVDPLRSQTGMSRDAIVSSMARILAEPDGWLVEVNQDRGATTGLQ